jgi:3-mercaptopyruvate sulfurtransferase SseA
VAPLEPQEKVLLSKDFLSSPHGELGCETCHGGDPASLDKAAGHAGLVAMPSVTDPQKACGDCHAEIAAGVLGSLHGGHSTFPRVLAARAGKAASEHVEEARKNHCAACHTSCGGCHVSRPAFAGKGFLKGHTFQKRSDPIQQCTACHGSRVGSEFYGERGQGDVHAARAGMDCVACHPAKEMHASSPADISGRYHLKELSRCTGCHTDLQYGSVRDHAIHVGKVQCQVCHSQTYVSCYECHVGKDAEGTAYFQGRREAEGFKIGLNYDRASGTGYRYMVVRHVPAYPEMFDFYGKDLFPSFSAVPTWKRASPHNIQRRTWQAASCNNCHGNRALFLSSADLEGYERAANAAVVVPDGKVPKKIAKTQPLAVDTSKVRKDMVVDPRWLHENLGKKGVVIVDARSPGDYAKGHIDGAVALDPMTAGLRTGADGPKPFVLKSHAEVTAILGRAGLSSDDHLVVYDQAGFSALVLLSVLDWAGAGHVSFLDGGIEGWHAAGFHTSEEATVPAARAFGGKARPELVATSAEVAKLVGTPGVVVLDARALQRTLGETRHEVATRAGAIPGSVGLPFGALMMDNGVLRPPAEALWVLRTRGITPDKQVITTCDTGIAASDAYFVLRYLGFENVRVHDEAWVGWTRTN